MKLFCTVFALGMMTAALGTSAQADCLQLEAEMIARVETVQPLDAKSCAITVSFDLKNAVFDSSYLCPLDIEEVFGAAILVPRNVETGQCPYAPGATATGVVYRSADPANPRLILE